MFVDDIENRLGRPDEQDKLDKETINAELSTLKNLTEEDARELLGAVFPKVDRVFSRYRSEASWGKAEWRTQGRACASFTTFSRYFVFSVDESELSAADKDALWNAARAVDDLETYLRSLTGEKLFSVYEFLTDIDAAAIEPELLRNIVTATIDIGDEFAVLPGFDDMLRGPMLQAQRALIVLLRAQPENARFELALEVFRRPPRSIQMPSAVAFSFGKLKEGFFTEEQVQELQRVCRELYQAAWERGEFVRHPRFLAMLPDWIGRDEPKTDGGARIRASLEDDDAKFLELLGRYENVQFDRFEPDRFNTKYLTQIYTLEEMRTRLESIRDNPNHATQRQRVEELIQEVQRQIEGGEAAPEPFLPVAPQTGFATPDDLPIED